jgi:large subunit ribosomal protein L21
LNNVLLVQKDDGKSLIGDPMVKNAKVEAEVVKQFRDEKVIVFKKRRRKNSRRKNGHRQSKTTIKILNIVA